MSHSNDSATEYAWFLTGETIQATFDEDIELSLTSSPDSAANGITNSIPLVPSTHSSLNPFDTRKTTGPFASLRTAAGNVFQGKDSQESSTDLPQYHYQHNIRQYIRNRTHTHQDQPRKFQQTPASSPSQFSRQSPVPLPKKHRLVITNFRICSLQQIPDGQHMIRIQIALGTIATIALQEPHRIIITLKFDSPQFTILQHPPGSPVVAEVMSNLCRLVFNIETRLRFPYQMGSSIVGDGRNSKAKTKDDGPVNASLWTAEEIFTLSPKIHNNATTKNRNASISEDHHLRKILGWTDGYDILNEFKRLQFDETQWSVVNLNEDFELSPTYPERFIMPNAFLDSGNDLRHPGTRYSSQQDYTSSSPQPDSPSACIKQLVAFRSNKRFPIVCWKSPETGLILMRSSQPMVGFLGSRGAEDELYIRTVLNTAARERRRSHVTAKFAPKLCIMDARAITSAIANGCKGGGRENPGQYKDSVY
ncbi:Myotubularin- protein 2 [Entomortierella chlamydospora]|uniref:Myotubularin- protein 2 n=1 Tax=Entomortierella chlamydospora TaxID=101097 RepID=A0A9P6MV94_9FUNG|nr:Myotubularin- protein 2 [Entomortierella chlamydospora]